MIPDSLKRLKVAHEELTKLLVSIPTRFVSRHTKNIGTITLWVTGRDIRADTKLKWGLLSEHQVIRQKHLSHFNSR